MELDYFSTINVGSLSLTFTFLIVIPVQTDTLFKTLNSENLCPVSQIQDPQNHALFRAHTRLGQFAGCPHPGKRLQNKEFSRQLINLPARKEKKNKKTSDSEALICIESLRPGSIVGKTGRITRQMRNRRTNAPDFFAQSTLSFGFVFSIAF